MKIDLLDYLENKIDDTSWYGEINHDDISAKNMEILDDVLTEIEDIRENLLSRLYEHENYREGNASAEHLHKIAMNIIEKHVPNREYEKEIIELKQKIEEKENEKQRLISFLENNIKAYKEWGEYLYEKEEENDKAIRRATIYTFQEVLYFVKKGGW